MVHISVMACRSRRWLSVPATATSNSLTNDLSMNGFIIDLFHSKGHSLQRNGLLHPHDTMQQRHERCFHYSVSSVIYQRFPFYITSGWYVLYVFPAERQDIPESPVDPEKPLKFISCCLTLQFPPKPFSINVTTWAI